MSLKVALLVVFNHRYDANLPKLREMYADRFSHVFFLMPFYDLDDDDVIPTYYASSSFQGYFVNAYQRLEKENFDYWFVVSDDMLINPTLNEENLEAVLNLEEGCNFIPNIRLFDRHCDWDHAWRGLQFTLKDPFSTCEKYIPSKEFVLSQMKKFGLSMNGLDPDHIYPKRGPKFLLSRFGKRYLDDQRSTEKGELLFPEYPFVWGYADIFCISKSSLKDFCHYCGVFAAGGLFVEIAIPTALIMASTRRVVTEEDTSLAGRALWREELEELDIYEHSLEKLVENFPSDQLFIHPVKLSEWS